MLAIKGVISQVTQFMHQSSLVRDTDFLPPVPASCLTRVKQLVKQLSHMPAPDPYTPVESAPTLPKAWLKSHSLFPTASPTRCPQTPRPS